MSDGEKARIIGEAVSAFQEARVELACIDAKLDLVRAAYLAAINSIGHKNGRLYEIQIHEGALKFGVIHPSHPEDLLDGVGLKKLVESREQAQSILSAAKAKVGSLGITSLG